MLLNNDRTVNDEKDNLVEPKLSFTQVDEKLNQLVSVPTINHASSPSNETAYDEYSRKEEIIDNIQCPSTDIIIDNLPSTFSSLNHTSNALLNVSLTLLPATQTIQLSPLNTVNNLQKSRLKCETNNFKESPGETTAIEDFTTAFSEFDALFFDHEKILSYEETVSVGIELGLDYQLSVLEDGCKRKEIESDNKERDGLLMKRAKV